MFFIFHSQKSLVITVPEINAVLLHYPCSLELWQLGSTAKTSGIISFSFL